MKLNSDKMSNSLVSLKYKKMNNKTSSVIGIDPVS